MASNEPGNPGGRYFAIAVAMGIIGGGALLGGVSLILGRNASNHLADFGLLLLIVAGVANLAAIAMGLRFMLVQKMFLWWWPISLLLAVAAVVGGVIALNL
ncbi:MAG TPA: hypothetical protein EYQ74_00875 [Planctomycetes bacterium]|nr:hypothetical protein [Planctomycetota bacterium]